ncbi:hypothetical protein AB0L57_27360 [Nocardia sp. NPDC052254]|uniref:hypothetical protein n=1 Tax=Nocardia sp. NPDC052254 TaxID=3155681 RepID=UPI00341B6AD9
MSDICLAEVERLAGELGFSCANASPFVTLRDPLHPANWTLPLLEFTVVAGAVLALVAAVRRLRGTGDPTDLVLWFSGVVYLLIIEPPIYFPRVFGVEDQLGIVFVHNEFTVDFLFDRLPLYIVALYPALLTLACHIVRGLGIVDRYGPLAGAVAVGFVHSCFYEIFDHLGPQLRWWIWNSDNAATRPAFASVPIASIAIFSALAPALLAYLVHRLVALPFARGQRPGAGALVCRTISVGILTSIGIVVCGIPAWIFPGRPVVQGWVYWVEIGVVAIGGAVTVARALGARCGAGELGYVRIFGAAFLAVMVIGWGAAMPEYLGATGGITASGTPTGNLAYASICFLVALVLVVASFTPVDRSPIGRMSPVTGRVRRYRGHVRSAGRGW